jgi:hypothetical protein
MYWVLIGAVFVLSFTLFASGVATDALISGLSLSDDFNLHRAVFEKAARELITSKQCSAADFKEFGGFVRSPNRGNGHYFIYCGGMTGAGSVLI